MISCGPALNTLIYYLKTNQLIGRIIPRKLTKGVPRGSVLGSTLLTIYTIELSWILKKHNVQFKLYADDTQFYFAIETVQDTTNKIRRNNDRY